jgi:WD40 repeat protein
MWDLVSKRPLTSFTNQDDVIDSLAFSPDGSLLASSSGFTLRLWDMTGNTNRWTRTTNCWPRAPVFTPDWKSLITGGGVIGNPILWDA